MMDLVLCLIQNEVPFTPKEADAYWANFEKEHPVF